jgi:hypothetical protein
MRCIFQNMLALLGAVVLDLNHELGDAGVADDRTGTAGTEYHPGYSAFVLQMALSGEANHKRCAVDGAPVRMTAECAVAM